MRAMRPESRCFIGRPPLSATGEPRRTLGRERRPTGRWTWKAPSTDAQSAESGGTSDAGKRLLSLASASMSGVACAQCATKCPVVVKTNSALLIDFVPQLNHNVLAMKKGQKLNRPERHHTAIRIPTSLTERLQALAVARHSNVSALVLECVMEQITNLETRYRKPNPPHPPLHHGCTERIKAREPSADTQTHALSALPDLHALSGVRSSPLAVAFV